MRIVGLKLARLLLPLQLLVLGVRQGAWAVVRGEEMEKVGRMVVLLRRVRVISSFRVRLISLRTFAINSYPISTPDAIHILTSSSPLSSPPKKISKQAKKPNGSKSHPPSYKRQPTRWLRGLQSPIRIGTVVGIREIEITIAIATKRQALGRREPNQDGTRLRILLRLRSRCRALLR
jgi:hypothetical protein